MQRILIIRVAAIAAALAVSDLSGTVGAAELRVEKSERGATITIDGQPYAEYLTNSGHQPAIWPIIGPGGQPMTRQYPLADKLPTEKDDHGHHRSLWFNHGLVNGKDFWKEPSHGGPPEEDTQIAHREFATLESGETARVVARNDWTSGGEKLCEDERTIEFGADGHGRWIDFTVKITASEGDVVFGDTKEGSFGIRVPGTMDVEAKKGGRILNSNGQRDEDAWGRSAEWVDYHGPVGGKPAGITIFEMPDSFRHPTKWHVRTYGLFAANPFGEHDFPKGEPMQGEHKLAKGDSLRLHYRVLFYDGERSAEELANIYQEYRELNHQGTKED
jgi:hypothetical protein